ncbi:MAG: DUF1624 domain-containing protein [Anaerolineales bacterium]|nr:DUF1624 domain-containing protein [Anaerolineales bacterium]
MTNGDRGGGRIRALDSRRGLMMILMALDHALFFIAKIHPLEYWGAPLPEYPDGVSFFVRLLSHLCAPGFFFLMGAGMAMFAESRRRQRWSGVRIARHLVLRGLLLIFLQLFVVNPAWFLETLGPTAILGNVGDGAAWINLEVLFGLGGCLLILPLALRVPGVVDRPGERGSLRGLGSVDAGAGIRRCGLLVLGTDGAGSRPNRNAVGALPPFALGGNRGTGFGLRQMDSARPGVGVPRPAVRRGRLSDPVCGFTDVWVR